MKRSLSSLFVAVALLGSFSSTAFALREAPAREKTRAGPARQPKGEDRFEARVKISQLRELKESAKPSLSRDDRQENKKEAKPDFALVEAAIAASHAEGMKRGNINHFIETLARGESVTVRGKKVGLEQFKNAFENGYGQVLEAAFRGQAVDPVTGHAGANAHEFIPSNLLVKVIGRSLDSKDLRWVHLQDEMRSPTDQIIFSPTAVHETDKKGRWIPMGHDGAVYDISTRQASGNWKNGSPQIVGQAAFHDELRAAFAKSATPDEVIDGIEQVVKKWVWNGELDSKIQIAPGFANDGKQISLHRDEFKQKQATRYHDMLKMLETMKAKYRDPQPVDTKLAKPSGAKRSAPEARVEPALSPVKLAA